MNSRLLLAFAGLIMGATLIGAAADEQKVPAPPGARLLLEAAAQGVQIYSCEKGADGDRWVFSAPDAALFDIAGRQVGSHFAGPTWQMDDDSKIVGEAVSQAPPSEAHAIAWLLLRVKSHDGRGALSDVDFVRRIDTQAGTAPAGACTATKGSPQARMRYTARYLFYAAAR